MNDIVIFFDDLPIRKIKINNEWWISAIDTARSIGYKNPSRESINIINRNKLRFERYIRYEKIESKDKNDIKYMRKTLLLNLKGVIAFCLLSKLPNAIPFQRWADEVLANHIKEKVKRKQIYGELTDDSVETRNLETKQWQRHGAKGKDFGSLTKKEYKLIFDDENKKKTEMNGEELLKLMISNATNALGLMQEKYPVGVNGIENQIYKSAKLIKNATNKKIN